MYGNTHLNRKVISEQYSSLCSPILSRDRFVPPPVCHTPLYLVFHSFIHSVILTIYHSLTEIICIYRT
jgi:hypothetical protein